MDLLRHLTLVMLGDMGKQPTVGADAAYGTSTGSNVGYPIKPTYEDLDVSDDVNAY